MSETIAPSGARTESRRPIWAAAVTMLVLSVAVTAGLLSSPEGGTPVIFVERISSAISGLTSGAGSGLWWVYAFFLGIVAAFNPCGFALLPAYLGLYLNDERTEKSFVTRTRRSLAVSAVAPDGIVEAIEAPQHPFLLGVQWHPEFLYDRDRVHRRLFLAFLRAARG